MAPGGAAELAKPAPARNHVVVGRDLVMEDGELEQRFKEENGAVRSQIDLRIALLRACLLPMLITSQRTVGSATGTVALACLAFGTCLVVPLALKFDRQRFIRHYRSPLLVALVVAQVVAAHWHAPTATLDLGATRVQVVIHLMLGNGVFYQHLAHHLSPHLWPWMLTQHVLVLGALVALNGHMCVSSVTLRAGYASLRALLPRPLLALLCLATSPSGPGQHWPPSTAACLRNWAGAEAMEGPRVASVHTCCHGQLMLQLTLGCLLPLWWAYSREARERQRWIQARGLRPVMAGGSLLDFVSFMLPLLCAMLSLHAHRLLPAIY